TEVTNYMAVITLEKGKALYTYGQPMTALHLITSGKLEVSYPGGVYQLGKGDVVGIGEVCSEIHFLGYTAIEDTTYLTFPLTHINSLEDLLQKNPDMARLFLLSIFRQINILQNRCSISELNCSNLSRTLTEDYDKYCSFCTLYRLPARILDGYEDLSAYLGEESSDLWLNGYYQGLAHIYASDNYKEFVAESSVSIGMIRKGSLDFRRTYLSLEEQFNYQQQLASFYFHESGNDLFDFYTSLYYKLGSSTEEANELLNDINRMLCTIKKFSALANPLLETRIQSFHSNKELLTDQNVSNRTADIDSSIISDLAGSLNQILDFAGADLEIASSFRQHVNAYRALADRSALEEDVTALRRVLTEEFYQLYTTVFKRSLEITSLPIPVRMFLYFGYVDEDLAGTANAAVLYSLASNMADHSDSGVYTLYDWLLAIYDGHKEPSRNEFDQDYSDYVHKQKVSGNLSDLELRELEKNAMAKVDFELQNMFPVVNKISYGRIATFCPLFSDDNVLKDLNTALVTASQLGKIIQQIRQIDYTAFYRESFDNEHMDLFGKEMFHVEYLPDIILMPNVGIRGVMWQEVEGKRRNSCGRMFFSIFHLEDLKTSFIRMTGEFRWELCKRVQGNRWNDVSESSLTSEYFDYIQFYRKNNDLTSETKEKVRTSLQRAKNSFKEMFVRDYIIWVLFEGNGSPRLNKVARRILFTYCPFPADIIDTLSQNPLYAELLNRHQIHTAQKLHHLNALQKKLLNSGKRIPDTLEKELNYVKGVVQ
ncbi:MAG: cyclic nucleotide-binding domain-containing protein, partial [Lachnospiraceae bacterium]|nr:cyclic nucleotide-binding domain-containing protein [Lachnospiraceae bacterium]